MLHLVFVEMANFAVIIPR